MPLQLGLLAACRIEISLHSSAKNPPEKQQKIAPENGWDSGMTLVFPLQKKSTGFQGD